MKTSLYLSHLIRFLSITCLLLQANIAFSSVEDAILDNFEKNLPGFTVESIELHEESGLYLIKIVDGPSIHALPNGKYFVVGDLYRLDASGLVNETQVANIAKVNTLPESDKIIFPAKGEEKAYVTVFTDITCHYCRLLHGEIDTLNSLGITVKYLAFPRAGLDSEPYQQMVNIWCSDDSKGWITEAKQGNKVPFSSCDNPVADQFLLGQSIGVNGTPTLILNNGKMIPGYLPATELARELDL
ncbi:thioredoxin fold domain-containing protein [Marinomonas sp.]|nr:thioredoxin fold domain-containing protein [Marinomonas sp.]MDB4837164.1 thioredoxin fold domain-containing protein [Marinomonas sp.]